ncbi:hypothetical protein EDB84DRAFT_1606703 [Lactarius hengduanensis]|nr:hypothetical protein EDB84DRAFT_1606703 [Lactarius hengduanensis]
MSDLLFLIGRAPVNQITVDPQFAPPRTGISMASKIALGCDVGVILLVILPISAIYLVRRRRRRRGRSHKRKSIRSSSPGGMITDTDPQTTVTPFSLMESTLTGATPLDAGSQTDQLQRVASVPVGLSSKELAPTRSRSRPTGGQTLTPFNPTGPILTGATPLDTEPQTDQQQPMTPVPVGGLSSEGFAQLSRSQPTVGQTLGHTLVPSNPTGLTLTDVAPLNTETQSAAPVPVGLSSDELAQLHLRSQPTDGQILMPFNPTGPTLTGAASLDTRPQTDQQQPVAPVPVGFSSKEPAQLRSRSRSTDRQSPRGSLG